MILFKFKNFSKMNLFCWVSGTPKRIMTPQVHYYIATFGRCVCVCVYVCVCAQLLSHV